MTKIFRGFLFVMALACGLGVSASAWAVNATPPTNTFTCSGSQYPCPAGSGGTNGNGQPIGWYSNYCSALPNGGYGNYTVKYWGANNWLCSDPANHPAYYLYIYGTPTCAPGTGTYNSSTGMCENTCPASGATDGNYRKLYVYTGSPMCYNGCVYSAIGVADLGGTLAAQIGSATGASCTSNGLGDPITTTDSCTAQGQGYITNSSGAVQCIPSGSASSVPSTASAVAAGNTASAVASAGGNSQGSGDVASAVATSTNMNGGNAPPTTQTIILNNPSQEFCNNNPNAVMCISNLGFNSGVSAASAPFDTSQLDQVSGVMGTDEAYFNSFFSWRPPAQGSCQPITGNIGVVPVTLDICATVNNLRDLLGWLFAIFGLFDIYGTLMGRRES